MRRVAGALAGTTVVLLLAGCWPMPGQNPNRTSHNTFESKITADTVGDLTEEWQYTMPYLDAPMQAPAVSPGRVHVTLGCGLATVNARTGEEEWVQTLPPTAEECEIFTWASSATGEPYVVHHPDGDRVVAGAGAWTIRPPAGYEESGWWNGAFDVVTGERLDDGASLVGGARGDTVVGTSRAAVGPATVATRLSVWSGDSTRAFVVNVAGSGGVVPGLTLGTDHVFHAGSGTMATEPGDTSRGSGVRAFSRAESRPGCGPLSTPYAEREVECPVWATATDGQPTRPTIGAGGAILYTRTSQTVYALDAATGGVLWTAEGAGGRETPALADGLLYVPASDGRVLVFDADGCDQETCEPLREISTGSGQQVSTPSVAGDVVNVTSAGAAYAFAASDCGTGTCDEVLWSAPAETQPVVAFGKVYTTVGNTLYSYGLG